MKIHTELRATSKIILKHNINIVERGMKFMQCYYLNLKTSIELLSRLEVSTGRP